MCFIEDIEQTDFSEIEVLFNIEDNLFMAKNGNEFFVCEKLTSTLWSIPFQTKVEFEKKTKDFNFKDYYFYYFNVPQILKSGEKKEDTSEFFKC